MKKEKLIKVREEKGYTQNDLADELHVDVSNYCRRENGETRIPKYEWPIIAKLLDVAVEDIYEAEDSQVNICQGNSTVYYQGTNIIYAIPDFILENQKKYIELLEREICDLKKENQALRGE